MHYSVFFLISWFPSNGINGGYRIPVFFPLFLLFGLASTNPSPSTVYLLFLFLRTDVPLCLILGSFFCLSKCDLLKIFRFEEPDFSCEKVAVEIPISNKSSKNNFFIKRKLNNFRIKS